jgi:hypothetical protein
MGSAAADFLRLNRLTTDQALRAARIARNKEVSGKLFFATGSD